MLLRRRPGWLRPIVDLPFAGIGASPGGVVFSRSSSGTFVGSDRLLATANTDIPRFDYDPVTATGLGLLVESTTTNYALWSRDLTNAVFSTYGMTTAKTATGADGAANAATTITSTVTHGFIRQPITRASAQRVTSAWIRRRTGTGTVGLSQGATTGSELVTNGTFDSTTTGWTASLSTLAVSSGRLQVTAAGSPARALQSVAVTIGKVYRLDYDAINGTRSAGQMVCGTTSGGFDIGFNNSITGGNSYSFVFAAPTATIWIGFGILVDTTGTFLYDNISLKEVVETTIVPTADWQRFSTAPATMMNPVAALRLATSGDAVDVDFVQHEEGSFATSAIMTTTASASRQADSAAVILSEASDILVQDSAGAAWTDAVAAGSVVIAPRSGQRHIARWRAFPAGVVPTAIKTAMAVPA